MSDTSKLFKPPFRLVGRNLPNPPNEYFMRIVNVDGADLKAKDLEELLCRANSQPDLLKACEGLMEKADNGSADFDDPVPGSIYLKAKAALAKAQPSKTSVEPER